MFYYQLNNKILISEKEYSNLGSISEDEAKNCKDMVYMLNELDPLKSRRSFSVSDPSLAFLDREGLELLLEPKVNPSPMPRWLISKIKSRQVTSINTAYPSWQDVLHYSTPSGWRINIAGLGDVGGILCSGLRLMGDESISKIGLYDIDDNKIKRWVSEVGQILPPFCSRELPEVSGITENEIFDCDMFVFCVSVGVPPIGSEKRDVRLAQFEGNSRVIKTYAKKAREHKFKGIFAVVSDPVDLLCKVVFNESNTNDDSIMDFKGLSPEQIRGYGLGVMNGRAAYYAKQNADTLHYLKEGRVFGPHGKGLIVADSIENYDEDLSLYLTEKVQNANLAVRAAGFKPYIAPALSSGSLSIISTIKGEWHYSATFMGGVFMGSKNRFDKSGIELERLDIPKPLWKRLENTFESLGAVL